MIITNNEEYKEAINTIRKYLIDQDICPYCNTQAQVTFMSKESPTFRYCPNCGKYLDYIKEIK